MDDQEDIDQEDIDQEQRIYFAGCTCEHDKDEHGWGECDVEGCGCQGGWEE